MTWWSFSEMRAEPRGKSWLRRQELIDALRAEGFDIGPFQVRQAVIQSGLPKPEKRYGHFHYTREHMEAVRAYAVREGFVTGNRI